MRHVATLAVVIFIAATPAALQANTLFYGGDPDPTQFGIANNSVTQDGSDHFAVLDDFQVPAGSRWNVSGLFSINEADSPFDRAPFDQAVWSIRTGVATGVFGNTLFAGISPAIVTATGRVYPGLNEYAVSVTGLAFDLDPGTYFLSVSPYPSTEPAYYLSVPSTASNRTGPGGPNGTFQESLQTADGQPQNYMFELTATGSAPLGVLGDARLLAVPEPSTFVLVALALAGLLGFTRHVSS